jgi:dTDP-4-amino-4,6-dideoxygalactose transaminase
MFGLPEKLRSIPSNPEFLQGNPILLFNARSCINLVVNRINPGCVWLPSYLTDDILAGINPETPRAFYPVNPKLGISNRDFIKDIQKEDLFLFIDYFGFPFDSSIIEDIRKRQCAIFRDCTQALFHDWKNDDCDYYIFAPRKFLGIPDGGILQCKREFLINKSEFSSPQDETFYKLFSAFVMRREFDKYNEDRKWFELFQEGEEELKAGNQLMSDLSIMLLKYAFDYKELKQKRRFNYLTLNQKLKDFALYSRLDASTVPLGYPIVIPDRDKVRTELFGYNIFPPVHWDISGFVPKDYHESHQLSKCIMTLPCDHRYDERDMHFIADTFLRITSQ